MMLGRLILGCVLSVAVSSNVGRVEQVFSIYETPEKIRADGFEAETHHVTTSDGYILEMHRIPRGRSVEDTTEDKPVVFLMHGLLSSSQSFIGIGAELSFAYNLADAGFDVWMGNARGNKNSRFHTSLDPDDEQEKFEFFDFSFEEIGMYDLPAMIDYALEYTKKDQLHYIGHSQGGTVFLIMATMLPEYNDKLISVHLLAGVGYQDHFPNTELRVTALMTDIIYALAVRMGTVELFPPGSIEMLPEGILPYSESDYCLGDVQLQYMCQLIGTRHLLPASRNYNAATDQAGAALKQIAHYGQNIRDRLFRRYHYGTSQNIARYGTALPPPYDLSLITSDVTMHYTLNDNLLDERDVLAMIADMPNAIARQVPRASFLHEDFVIADDAKELVTDYIIEAIQNTRPEDHFTENDVVTVGDGTTTTVDPTVSSTAVPDHENTVTLEDEDGPTTTVDPSVSSTAVPDHENTVTLEDEDGPTTTVDPTVSSTPIPDDEDTVTLEDVVLTTPSPDGAATVVINVYLMILSLYVMLKQ